MVKLFEGASYVWNPDNHLTNPKIQRIMPSTWPLRRSLKHLLFDNLASFLLKPCRRPPALFPLLGVDCKIPFPTPSKTKHPSQNSPWLQSHHCGIERGPTGAGTFRRESDKTRHHVTHGTSPPPLEGDPCPYRQVLSQHQGGLQASLHWACFLGLGPENSLPRSTLTFLKPVSAQYGLDGVGGGLTGDAEDPGRLGYVSPVLLQDPSDRGLLGV